MYIYVNQIDIYTCNILFMYMNVYIYIYAYIYI